MITGRQRGAGSQKALHARNVDAVVTALRAARDLSQADIARVTGLSAGSVSAIVHDLAKAGRIAISPNARRQRINLCAPPGLVAGVDIGRSHVRLLLGDLAGDVVAESMKRLEPGTTMTATIAEIARQLAEVVAAAPPGDVLGACVGVAGPISSTTGAIVAPTLLPEWFDTDIAAAFTASLGLPVIVENDANLGAIAEARVNPPDEDLVYIKVGTGVGGGIVLGGRLRRGASNAAGEIGHMPMEPNGVLCRCGNRGCVETVASVPAIMDALRMRMPPVATIDDVVALALAGDASCARVLAEAGAAIGFAAAIVCTLLNPHHIVVGGSIVAAGDLVLGPLRDALRRNAVPASGNNARVTASAYGDRASAVGALLLAGDAFTPAY